MPKFDKHIFVCGNQRPAGHPRDAAILWHKPDCRSFSNKTGRAWPQRESARQSIRLPRSMRTRPNVVVYPDAVWYGHVTEADVDEIIESHIVGGKPVERLRLAIPA